MQTGLTVALNGWGGQSPAFYLVIAVAGLGMVALGPAREAARPVP